jgi:hypothetical protein
MIRSKGNKNGAHKIVVKKPEGAQQLEGLSLYRTVILKFIFKSSSFRVLDIIQNAGIGPSGGFISS